MDVFKAIEDIPGKSISESNNFRNTTCHAPTLELESELRHKASEKSFNKETCVR